MSSFHDHIMAYWVKQLGSIQLPAHSNTIQELNRVVHANDSSATQLAEIILKDSALTARVLRVANSVHNNPNAKSPINTISRAVVQLGFHGVKAISLSVMLVESLLNREAKERVIEWMARGFHTGVQAGNLIRCIDGPQRVEEVFITSLLLHLGELTFWSCRDDVVSELDEQLPLHSTGDQKLERAILGTTMREISCALAKSWGLKDYVSAALNTKDKPGITTQAVLLGEQICFAAEKGWNSQALRDVVVKVSMFTGKNLEDSRKLVEDGAEKAAKVAITYGANRICHYIPSTVENNKKPKAVVLQADLQLQLDVLRDINTMVEQVVDTNTLFQTVVEGIHRGIGLERVALCLIDPVSNLLTAKYILGEETEPWRHGMKFSIERGGENLFAYCLMNRQHLCLQSGAVNKLDCSVDKQVRQLVTVDNLVMAPIYAGTRPIGVLVADRGKIKTAISQTQQESFDHFADEISSALAKLSARKRALAQ